MLSEIDRGCICDRQLTPPEEIYKLKLMINNETVARWPEDPLVGLEIGQAYKGLIYGLIRDWYEEHIPEDLRANIGVAAFGSTARGELCFHSDLDLAIYHNGGIKRETVETIKKELSSFLEGVGLRPEIKVWGLRPNQRKLMQEDLVVAETVLSSESVAGQLLDLDTLRGFASNKLQEKALYSIFESKRPRFKRQEEDVFNLKWAEGGLRDFLVLRSIALASGIEEKTTLGILRGLQVKGVINDGECQFLSSTLSEYMVLRNAMHIFAGDVAERLGPRTRRYISQQIQDTGQPDQLKEHLNALRREVRTITRRVIIGFLQEMGVDSDLYENFSDLTADEQLRCARSVDRHLVELAAWSSEKPEVLMACLKTNPSWSTLQAISRSESFSAEVFYLAEKLTRYRKELEFARMQLVVNPSVPIDTLVAVYRYTNNDKIKRVARKRLAHFHYEGCEAVPTSLEHQVDVIVFYPHKYIPEGLFRQPDLFLQPTPGKLYINFAGRLAQGKNFIEYLHILETLHLEGVDFEAHVFGIAEPGCVEEIQNFWDTVKDFSFIDEIKYHGRYTLDELSRAIDHMQQVGSAVFLLPKGLVSKELLSMGVPILTTKEGNYDIEQSGLCLFDENNLSDTKQIVAQIRNCIDSPDNRLRVQTKQVQAKVQRDYSLEKWGGQLTNVFEEIQPDSRNVLLLGTSPLNGPHGPATWSRNLILYLEKNRWEVKYVYPEDIMQPTAQLADTPLKDETGRVDVLKHLLSFVSSILLMIKEGDANQKAVSSAHDALICISSFDEALDVLTTQQAQEAFNLAVTNSGFDPANIHYPSMVLDEVNIYGTVINPILKLVRWIHLLKQSLPESGVIISHGTLHPLIALREKQKKGTPFVHIDHVLASDEPLLRGIVNNGLYSDLEKKWFEGLNTFLRSLTFYSLDRYIALWPVNKRIARTKFDIPPEKIVYIPNGVNTNFRL